MLYNRSQPNVFVASVKSILGNEASIWGLGKQGKLYNFKRSTLFKPGKLLTMKRLKLYTYR